MTMRKQKVMPCLWFDDQAEAAVDLYVSLFPNSKVTDVARYGDAGPGPAGSVMTMTFELDGQPFMALNGGPHFKFTPAVSFVIDCETQEEVDRYAVALTADGTQEQCGWVTDRFGLSWQVVPRLLGQLLSDPDPVKSQRVMQAMLGMQRLDMAGLQRAYDGA